MRLRTAGFISGTGILAMALGACGAGTDRPASASDMPLEVHGALSVVELAPVHLTVERIYPPGTKVGLGGAATLAGDNPPDLATNAETQVLRESLKQPDLRIIMTVAEGDYRIVARRSSGIQSVADLKGKRVGTWVQSSAGYFLARMLATEGMTLADVQVDEIFPQTALSEAIAEGRVDAISIWEPYSENAVHALGSDAVTLSGEGVYSELFNLNTLGRHLADPDKRRRIVSFMAALMDATEAMNRNPGRAQELVAQASEHSLGELERSWEHHTFSASFPDRMLDVLEQEEIWLAGLQQRAPRPRAELAKLIDRSAYEEALALRKSTGARAN